MLSIFRVVKTKYVSVSKHKDICNTYNCCVKFEKKIINIGLIIFN